MYYDYLITLDDEISFLWNRTGSVSWFWFFAVRYAGFVGNLPVTVFSFYTMEPKVSTRLKFSLPKQTLTCAVVCTASPAFRL